jgi:uncharacterized damage-inducible protein DinB
MSPGHGRTDDRRAPGGEQRLGDFRLHRACALLTDAEYAATRTSFFPSIKATLEHVYLCDVFYLDALRKGGRGRAMYSEPDPTFATCAMLSVEQRAVDRALLDHVASLPQARALDEVIVIPRRDHDQRERVGDVLQHLFQHQIHHRGQAHAMLAGTRMEPPQLDELFLAEELPLREADLRELGLPVR